MLQEPLVAATHPAHAVLRVSITNLNPIVQPLHCFRINVLLTAMHVMTVASNAYQHNGARILMWNLYCMCCEVQMVWANNPEHSKRCLFTGMHGLLAYAKAGRCTASNANRLYNLNTG
jgi:hypothetical protein